jgi:hypothetical protein
MVSIIKIIKIMTVLLLVSIIASSYNNNIVTATNTASTLSQSVQEVLPLSDQRFSSNSSTVNTLSNENSYDQQIAAVGNKSYVVWTDETTGDGDIYFKRSIDSGATFSNTTINLSNNTGSSENPQIAVFGNNVYVVWRDNIALEMFDILFKRSIDSGATFSNTTINLSNNTGSSLDPQIAVSGSNVYVVWADETTGNRDIYYIRSIDSGASFFAIKILSENNTGRSDDPQIAVSGSNVYVEWTDLTTGNGDIYFIRSIDGGASFFATKNLSENNNGASTEPKIAVSGSNVYVVWADQTTTTAAGNRDIYFKRSIDSGASFSNISINLSNNAGISVDPKIAAVSGNNVYVVWTDQTTGNNEILFKRSTNNGASFSNISINLSNNAGNNVYVVWTDQTTGGGDIYFKRSTNNGASFSNASINLSNNAGRSDAPQITASGSNVYVVWTDQTTGGGDIYFRTSTDGGATFGTIINLSNDAHLSYLPQIATSGSNVYVVWNDLVFVNNSDQTKLFFKSSTNSGASFGSLKVLLPVTIETIVPQIAAFGSNVYVAGNDGSERSQEIFFQRSTDNGASFSNAISINNNFEYAWLGNIVADGSNVYLTWRDEFTANGMPDVFFRRSTDGGASFDGKINLSNSAGSSVEPKIDIFKNNVYVVWADNIAPTNDDILFKSSTDGGASFSNTPINLSNNTFGFSRDPKIASVVSESSINVYVVWTDQSHGFPGNNQILFKGSTDGGATFSNTPINLSNNAGGSVDPQITSQITASGSSINVYVVWDDQSTGNGEILFKGSTDGGATFSNTPINLSNNTGMSIDPKIAAVVS